MAGGEGKTMIWTVVLGKGYEVRGCYLRVLRCSFMRHLVLIVKEITADILHVFTEGSRKGFSSFIFRRRGRFAYALSHIQITSCRYNVNTIERYSVGLEIG